MSRALGIPYAVAEASHAGKQAAGRWRRGHALVAEALARADLVIGLNRSDREGVLPLLGSPERYLFLPPFIDCAPYAAARLERQAHREGLLRRLGLAEDVPLLFTVGMMRKGAKLASYRLLGQALARLMDRRWVLLVAGDGEAEAEVRASLAPLGSRVILLGRKLPEELPPLYAASDIFLWPAIKEALGMVFVEAQAAGLPVVGAHNLGVPDVVDDGVTGLLPRYSDAAAFAEAAGVLLGDAVLRRRMGSSAAGYALGLHDLPTAGMRFAAAIEAVLR